MKNTSYSNRGMFLENIINESNTYYNSIEASLIFKKPTPIKVLNVSYPNNKSHLIDKAVYSSISTLDYNGIYKEKYIEFDAKETNSKTSFPISNIHKHQIEHSKNILYFKGIAFLIVRFNYHNKTFFVPGKLLIDYIDTTKKKSIPYSFFVDNCYEIKLKYSPRLDYLKIIDIL
jgi:recombination protein U